MKQSFFFFTSSRSSFSTAKTTSKIISLCSGRVPPMANANAGPFCTLCIIIISLAMAAQSENTDNPADELVSVINSNRTASNSSSLYSNPGLACIALQYIKAYQGDCKVVGGSNAKRPADSEFAETFAPNCGVEVSTLTQLTGRLLGCQSKYLEPTEAFSEVLMKNNRSVEILESKNHSEVGAAVSGSDGGGPYFWSVLFSNGKSNSSFVLEGGVAKISRPGCFSGANDVCSRATALLQISLNLVWPAVAAAMLPFAYAL